MWKAVYVLTAGIHRGSVRGDVAVLDALLCAGMHVGRAKGSRGTTRVQGGAYQHHTHGGLKG